MENALLFIFSGETSSPNSTVVGGENLFGTLVKITITYRKYAQR